MITSPRFLLSFFMICCLSLDCITGDIFTAICKVEELLKEEEKLQISLNRYIETERDNGRQHDEIHRFAEKLKVKRQEIKNNLHYVQHPINVFHLLYRIVIEWRKIFDTIWCDSCEITDAARDFNVTLEIVIKNIGYWPRKSDLYGVGNALLRLWRMYRLDLDKMINGEILDDKTEPLSTDQILTLLEYFDKKNDDLAEMKWLEALNRRIKNETDFLRNGMHAVRFIRLLAASYYKIGLYRKAASCLEEYQHLNNSGIIRDINFYQMRAKTDADSNVTESIPAYPMYEALCRSDQKDARELSKLRCFWRKTPIPYYRGKEEVVNYIPRVAIFHDVISKIHANILKKAAQKKFERSQVVSNRAGVFQETDDNVRVSQTAWIEEDAYPQLVKLAWRITMLTGLSAYYKKIKSHSERYQVLNYGVGGMYTAHTDNLEVDLLTPANPIETIEIQGTGDRIATWIFYLEDVKAGGATVFPKIKARVPVVKGSAAFWYNIKRNGDADPLTEHAGCPVLLGSKWVTNKWIRQEGQVFRRLCGLSEDAIDELPSV